MKAEDAQLHPGKEGVGKPSRLLISTHFGDNNTRIGYGKHGGDSQMTGFAS